MSNELENMFEPVPEPPARLPRGHGLPWPTTDRVRAPKNKPDLGTKVTVTKLMRRTGAADTAGNWWKTWVPKELPNPLQGVYIGYRTKQTGYTVFLGYEEGSGFVQTGTVSVALVVTDPRKAPIHVAWEGMK